MTATAIEALRAERELVIDLGRSLSADEWSAPSACEGWSVQDVIAHMASIFHPSPIVMAKAAKEYDDSERVNDVLVERRRGWNPQRQLGEYETWSRRAIRMLGLGQRAPLRSVGFNMGDLGTHPMHLLADAAVFDHYTHLRFDLLAPNGPLDRPALPRDQLRLAPTAAWTLALIAPMNQKTLAWIDEPIRLELTGPGAATTTVTRMDGRVATDDRSPRSEAASTVRSPVSDWVQWATGRKEWDACRVELDGEAELGQRFCETLHVV